MSTDMLPGENAVDTWIIYYRPPGGGKYNGRLTVTDQRLIYRATNDASLSGVLSNRAATGRFIIEKGDIREIDVRKGLFRKTATLLLADGSRHMFDRGALGIDKIVAAIEAH